MEEPAVEPDQGGQHEAAGANEAPAAPPASADTGLATVHRILTRIAREQELRSLVVVVDDPDLGRQAFRAGPGPHPDFRSLGAPAVHTEPASALDAELVSTLCAAALRVEILRPRIPGPGAAELALRAIPGVLDVWFDDDGDVLVVDVITDASAPDDFARQAVREVAPIAGRPVAVSVRQIAPVAAPASDGLSAPIGGAAPAAELLAVRTVPEDGEIEAHVRIGDARAVGRAPAAGGLAGAAQAVLDATSAIGGPGGLGLLWARTVETTADRRVVVAVALVSTRDRSERHAIAAGSNPIEACARATAQAVASLPDIERPGDAPQREPRS